ncbi:MAG: FAD-dependent oxidoreductase, partial [Chloroflexota bacterium]
MNKYKYIVVGNSAGGIAAARAIRRADQEGLVLMLSDEPYPAYSRPLIAKHISEGKDICSMSLVGPGFYEDNGIELRAATSATALDIENHTLELSNGEEAAYERLLLATGSRPIIPPVEGSGRRNVFTFTTYDDAAAIASTVPS